MALLERHPEQNLDVVGGPAELHRPVAEQAQGCVPVDGHGWLDEQLSRDVGGQGYGHIHKPGHVLGVVREDSDALGCHCYVDQLRVFGLGTDPEQGGAHVAGGAHRVD